MIMRKLLISFHIVILVASTGHIFAEQHQTCQANLYRRKHCGYRGIPKANCELRGCCYERTIFSTIPRCYRKVSDNVVAVCPTSENGRKPCGYRGIGRVQCKVRGCCFEEIRLGIPKCHMPVLVPILLDQSKTTTTTITTTTTTTTTTTSPPKPAVQRSSRDHETQGTQDKSQSPTAGDVLDEKSLSSVMELLRDGDWENATKSCEIDFDSRKYCGAPGISRNACSQQNCCWDDSEGVTRQPRCFYPIWRTIDQASTLGQSAVASVPTILKLPERSTGSTTAPAPHDNYDTTTVLPKFVPPEGDYHTEHRNLTLIEIEPPYNDSEEIVDPPIKDEELNPYTDYTTILPITDSHPQRQPVTNSATRGAGVGGLNTAAGIYTLFRYLTFYKEKPPPESSCAMDTSFCCRRPSSPCCEYANAQKRASNPDRRIVGGGTAGFLKVSVAYLTTETYASQFCGGTLIKGNWVVTAAHCVLDYCRGKKDARHIVIKLGKELKSNGLSGEHEQKFTASKVVCHPSNCKRGSQPRLNDIALIKLAGSAAMDDSHIGIAPLPYQGETPVEGQDCYVLGWGETRGSGPRNVLKQVKVPSYSNEQCNKQDWRSCMVRACMMCAGELNMDACEGDSGGPLFCKRRNGAYVLHGIYSWGRCGAEEKKPAVYTRFSYYVNWVKSVIRKDRTG